MTTYREAGVDIEEGDRLVEKIKPLAEKTLRPEVLSGVGGFSGLFALPPNKYREPVLVSGTDGVGTKLKLAFQSGRHNTIGIDLVAMSVNDIAVCGAEPLFFLDYFATSRLRTNDAAEVIKGIVEGCRQAGCTLLGGETAEMPGFYSDGEYDLAGFAVGVVERSQIIDGKKVQAGDVILGLESSGLHSNGYSLVRKILEERAIPLNSFPIGLDRTLIDLLLVPTKIYATEIAALQKRVEVLAIAHITGGGIPGNLPRTLPHETSALVHLDSWPRSPLWNYLAQQGSVPPSEMLTTFNLGIGLTVVVRPEQAVTALQVIHESGTNAWKIGEIVSGEGEPSVKIV